MPKRENGCFRTEWSRNILNEERMWEDMVDKARQWGPLATEEAKMNDTKRDLWVER